MRLGLFVFQESYSGCGHQLSKRATDLCEGISSRREWSVNPHTFTPSYFMPFTNYREFWCEKKLKSEDLITLKSMENHSERSIERALPWLLKLLEAETTGVANKEQVGTIFDPRIPQYLLKVPCP